MTAPSIPELRSLCERLATEAGTIARDGRAAARSDELGQVTKSSRTDVVTEFDRAAEAHIVAELRRLRPGDAIIGEEGTADAGTTGLAWYIDPIDGTTNFVYDQPSWSCSVAVALEDRTIAGAVFVAPLDELYSAGLGLGATRNGRPVRASGATDLSLALAGTGFAYDPATRRRQAAVVAGLIDRIRDIRRLGSAAADLCMVACGRLDLYFERHLNAWDAAAGQLVATEAGAVATDFGGGPARPAELLVAAPGVHAAAVDLLRHT